MRKLLLTLALIVPTIGFSQIDFVNFHKHMDSLEVKYTDDVYELALLCQEHDISFREFNRKWSLLYREYTSDTRIVRNRFGFPTTSNNRNKTWRRISR